MDLHQYEVPLERLRWQCDPALFNFDCTGDLPRLTEFIGQERASRAVEFGLSIKEDGYNIYVAGLTGNGKTSRAGGRHNAMMTADDGESAKPRQPLFHPGRSRAYLNRSRSAPNCSGSTLSLARGAAADTPTWSSKTGLWFLYRIPIGIRSPHSSALLKAAALSSGL